jgi:hypothetical protein
MEEEVGEKEEEERKREKPNEKRRVGMLLPREEGRIKSRQEKATDSSHSIPPFLSSFPPSVNEREKTKEEQEETETSFRRREGGVEMLDKRMISLSSSSLLSIR